MQKKYVRAIASYRWRLGTTRCNNDVTQGNSSTREAQRFNLCTQRFYNYLKRHHQPGTGSTNAWSGGRYFARKPQQIPPCFCYWLACTLNVHPQCLLMPLSRGPFSPNLLALTSRLTPDTHISGSLSYYDRPRIFFFNCQAIYVSSLFLYWSVFFHLTSLLTLILIWGDHCNKPNSLKEHEFICLVPGYLSIVQKKKKWASLLHIESSTTMYSMQIHANYPPHSCLSKVKLPWYQSQLPFLSSCTKCNRIREVAS